MTKTYLTKIKSMPATVNDPEAVQAILDEYDTLSDFEVDPATGKLSFSTDCSWPSALPKDMIPEELLDPFGDADWSDANFDELYDMHIREGDLHLAVLLTRLIPYLETPLKIQATDCTAEGDFLHMAKWTARPRTSHLHVVQEWDIDEEE